ncbi:KDGP aldolase [Neobacillus jeddahensis]|uniref:KDGP aldolase n=1 Tax=Neobacillus jeddahensis TaxID=1461580 RepID=UPI00058B4D5F|nr:KDGP aldolase [Neobacillus jeddahensis]
MFDKHQVIFNCLAKDVDNAKELINVGGDRVLIGLMVKSFPDVDSAIEEVKRYKENNIPVSVGLGAADPVQWRKVADVSAQTIPNHINQVYPASAYTLGRMEELGATDTIVNAVIEPTGTPGKVMISTGPDSSKFKETVSCELAATMLAEMGVHSIKFYPIDGDKRLDEVAAMAKAAAAVGIKYFEPTGGISLENVEAIVKTCLDSGSEVVIPHLYTSLIDKETGKTRPEYIEQLLSMKW